MLNILMLSKWHVHADGYAKAVNNSGRARVTAVWDEDAARGQAWADSLGAAFEADLHAALARPDVDAVVCDTPTVMHPEVILAAAREKKHIFTEKAMALSTADCEEMAKVIQKNNLIFTISLPQRFRPAVRLAKTLLDEGLFGTVSLVRFRVAHGGVSDNWLPAYWYENEKTGGGALMDLGCHPLYLCAYLLGRPTAVQAMMTRPLGSAMRDEYAVANILFENGAIGTAETGLINYSSPMSIEIFGSDATFLDFGGDILVKSRKYGEVAYKKLPDAEPAPILQFLDACLSGGEAPAHMGLADGILLTRLLEAAYLSHDEKRVMELG